MPRFPVAGATATHIQIGGREVLSFGGCNYLGLAQHPGVLAAVIRGLGRFGLSTSASRETTGNSTAHDELEAALCRFLGMPAALSFGGCNYLGLAQHPGVLAAVIRGLG